MKATTIMVNYLIVGLGGGIGAMLRYGVQTQIVSHFGTIPPWGTWLANVSGCLLFGLIAGWGLRQSGFSTEWRLFLLTGICGGYTTFSSFTAEALQFCQRGEWLLAFLYIGSTLLFGFLGLWVATTITQH